MLSNIIMDVFFGPVRYVNILPHNLVRFMPSLFYNHGNGDVQYGSALCFCQYIEACLLVCISVGIVGTKTHTKIKTSKDAVHTQNTINESLSAYNTYPLSCVPNKYQDSSHNDTYTITNKVVN